MNIMQSISIALFNFAMVFILLGLLYTFVRVFTDVIRSMEIKTKK